MAKKPNMKDEQPKCNQCKGGWHDMCRRNGCKCSHRVYQTYDKKTGEYID